LAARIRQLRLDRELNQEELADRAGLHSRYISRIEQGETNFGVTVLFQLAQGLDVHPAHILSELPVERRKPPASAAKSGTRRSTR
jgi:transcriptional regulator with XRE-family HTH domain